MRAILRLGADVHRAGLDPATTPALWPHWWGVDGVALKAAGFSQLLGWGVASDVLSKWRGVSCDASHAVVKLDLNRSGLQGALQKAQLAS